MFACSKCDAQQLKWSGRCTSCGSWGTLGEESGVEESKGSKVKKTKATITGLADEGARKARHRPTGIAEFDRALGGGIVEGSVLLLSGEPGIGKSTLVSQLVGSVSGSVLLSSGEESASQIRLRFERLGLPFLHVRFVEETSVEAILSAASELKPHLVVVDSIQTASTLELDGIAGSPNQIRASAVKLVELAKSTNIPVLIIGQITKDGSIAGPKLLEHMVDVVLVLHGDPNSPYRLLHTLKNRFGGTDEVGVFEMTNKGLASVDQPSQRFLAERQAGPGSIITCVMEGSRPFLVEVQALTDKTSYGYPVRKSSGFDLNRLQLLIAIANRHANAKLDDKDVYINVVGGIELHEPAADLAVLAAILSATRSRDDETSPLQETVMIGEVGLGGEIRSVPFLDRRIAEAERYGFKKFVTPKTVKHIRDLI